MRRASVSAPSTEVSDMVAVEAEVVVMMGMVVKEEEERCC